MIIPHYCLQNFGYLGLSPTTSFSMEETNRNRVAVTFELTNSVPCANDEVTLGDCHSGKYTGVIAYL
jgi:hypothetical protein